MFRHAVLALPLVLALVAGPAFAQAPACSPTVSAALSAWDTALTAAAGFGERAVAVAREKGRDLLLPLLGIDPKAVEGKDEDPLSDVWRTLEASRTDPAKREALCQALTQSAQTAKERAKDAAGAGIEALKRALEGIKPLAPPQPAAPKDDLIRT